MTSTKHESERRPARSARRVRLLVILLALATLAACRLYNIERQLPAQYAEFLSKVSHIITREERKIFLELPDDRKDGFIEEFWKRRDPDPDTEHNAYRAEYEERVERSAQLFSGEGRPGWQTDRGRIFILFGPPQERLTYPMDARGFCREIWYYGSFPVIFIDEHCSGKYTMTAINLQHLQRLNIAQGHFQRTFQPEKRLFDYKASLQQVRSEADVFEGMIWVDIPYVSIWFAFREERLETTFVVKTVVQDESGRNIWESRKEFPLVLDEEELLQNRDKTLRMEIPFVLEEDMERIRAQKLTMRVSVTNKTDGAELTKVLEFRLKP